MCGWTSVLLVFVLLFYFLLVDGNCLIGIAEGIKSTVKHKSMTGAFIIYRKDYGYTTSSLPSPTTRKRSSSQ
ncbi:hypothetical protein F4775DRAFT_535632 [Biscogniauxia sp. FL1348]|nr:hypothetical protein F4775DRAFT_535632 [Biscogniauxia sp. FL1348]